MPEQIVVKVGERTTPQQAARKVLVGLSEAKRVAVTGGRSTVATMSQMEQLIVAARPDVLESVERHRGARWTFVLPE